MDFHLRLRLIAVSLLSCGIAVLPCPALVSLNDGRDKFFVTGSASLGYDSNLFSSQDGAGAYVATAGLNVDYVRRAGLIGVDAGIGLNAARYDKFSSEDFKNPRLSIEFTKQSGRTTGSLSLSAARENRADSAANVRTQSWSYIAGLSLKYPVIERYSLSGSFNYNQRNFVDNLTLVDLKAFTAGIDLFYVYTSERDLFAGYRLRQEQTSADSANADHAFTLGLSGKILPKLNGAIRAGYQIRQESGTKQGQFSSWTSSGSTTWNVSKRLAVTGQLSKDFSTTSTNITTDTLAASLDAQLALRAKMNVSTSVGCGQIKFLDGDGAGRTDHYFNYSFSLNYSMNEHLKASLTYAFFQNFSNLAFSDFIRHSITLSLSSRW